MSKFIKMGAVLVVALGVQSCALAADSTGSVKDSGAKIPIGDGKISNAPKNGYVYSCQTRFNPNAPGAQASGSWIVGDYWYPELKPSVSGNVIWSNDGTEVSVSGNVRKITSKNFPSHGTGIFPVQSSDEAYQYDRNPNSISGQNISLNLTATPSVAGSASCVPMGMVGISLTGAVFYNALDARGDDAVAHEIQDKCAGHPEHSGQYHYHGPSDCLVAQPSASAHSGLVGYAMDGFGIFGFKDSDGEIVDNSELDECHGHSEIVTWDGVETAIYHYHLTAEYPYTIGCFRGNV